MASASEATFTPTGPLKVIAQLSEFVVTIVVQNFLQRCNQSLTFRARDVCEQSAAVFGHARGVFCVAFMV
ncbi:MAG: hypothetical protein ACC619_11190 [Paracoccaceae bacterium]